MVARTALLSLCLARFALCAGYSDPLTLDQLKASVETGDTGTITDWVREQYAYVDEGKGPASGVVPPNVQTLFLYAVQGGKRDVVNALMDAGVDPNAVLTPGGESPLYVAVAADDHPMLDALQRGGADPLYGLPDHDAPLSHMLWLSFANHDMRFPDLCFARGLDPDRTFAGLEHDSLLNLAIRISSLEAFRYLLARNADITIVRGVDHYETTLALAIQHHGDQSDYVRLLRDLGAYDRKYTSAIPDQATATTDRLRIRESPDLSGRILGFLNKGDAVRILEVTPLSYTIDGLDSPWIRIGAAKRTGWVFGGYLSAVQRF